MKQILINNYSLYIIISFLILIGLIGIISNAIMLNKMRHLKNDEVCGKHTKGTMTILSIFIFLFSVFIITIVILLFTVMFKRSCDVNIPEIATAQDLIEALDQ